MMFHPHSQLRVDPSAVLHEVVDQTMWLTFALVCTLASTLTALAAFPSCGTLGLFVISAATLVGVSHYQ